MRKSVILLALVCFAAMAARKAGTPLKPGLNFFSKQQDIELGKEAAQQVRQQYQVVDSRFLQDYIKGVGDRLAAAPEAKDSGFQFTFTVLNQPEVNAFALPGGPMFILTGLIKATDNEAQLAAVMGHEMSHVILRHGTHEASKANMIQLPVLLAGAVIGNGSLLGQLASMGLGLGANSFLLKFSRDAETEADAMGSHLMAAGGYDPAEMARFFRKLQGSGGQGSSAFEQFLSDHPNPLNRERAIEDEIRTLPRRTYSAGDNGQFQRARSEVATLPPPPKRQTAPSAQPPQPGPAGSWRDLNARRFRLQHPGNWEVFGDTDSSMMTIAPRDGLVKTANGSTQIGYGAILAYFIPEKGRANLRAATDDLIRHLRTDNPGMRQPKPSRSAKVDRAAALVTFLDSASPYGGGETDAVLTVLRPEGLFYMVFIAPSDRYNNLEATFEQMLNSLRFN